MKNYYFTLLLLTVFGFSQAQDKPNILVIWGDDIGYSNISINNQGMMGYQTPNIDRIRHEGVHFKNSFVTLSMCAPARAGFLTGTYPQVNGMMGMVNRYLGQRSR